MIDVGQRPHTTLVGLARDTRIAPQSLVLPGNQDEGCLRGARRDVGKPDPVGCLEHAFPVHEDE
jgi:hypothetical protein